MKKLLVILLVLVSSCEDPYEHKNPKDSLEGRVYKHTNVVNTGAITGHELLTFISDTEYKLEKYSYVWDRDIDEYLYYELQGEYYYNRKKNEGHLYDGTSTNYHVFTMKGSILDMELLSGQDKRSFTLQ